MEKVIFMWHFDLLALQKLKLQQVLKQKYNKSNANVAKYARRVN